MKLISNSKLIILITATMSVLSFSFTVFSQTIDTAHYRKDALGSQKNRKRDTVLDGNNISTLAFNNGELGQWPYSPSFKWPNDSNGLNYIAGLTLLFGSEVKTNKGKNYYSIETYYREFMDSPSDFFNGSVPLEVWNEPLGFSPSGGYTDSSSHEFAKSNDPSTWPVKWPSALGLKESQNGKWINRLYPFSKPANLETFYVMDDSKDFEFTYPTPRGRYYPIKSDEPKAGSTISDELKLFYNPEIRKGLGLRVEAGTYQWNTSKLKNTLFVINDIYNLSDTTYDKPVVGLYIHPTIGGFNDMSDDSIIWNSVNMFAQFFDSDNKSQDKPSVVLGQFGIVFLETPSNSLNNIDDDGDGWIDESQTNGIDDDKDWSIENDLGSDGISNTNDFGESDGKPTPGEPNYEFMDSDESDMVGLKSMIIFKNYSLFTIGSIDGPLMYNDKFIFDALSSKSIGKTEIVGTPFRTSFINQILMGISDFQLPVQSKIRFSYAVIFGKDSTDLYQNVKWAREAYSAGFTTGAVGVGVKENQILPDKIQLNQNYPNPFNPLTTISITLSGSQEVSLKVYDLLGREIQTLQSGILNSGVHKFSFNGSQLTSGVYFVKLVSGNYSETKKMVLMK